LALGIVLGFVVGIKALQIKALIDSGGDFQLPPEYVTSATLTEDSWKQTLSAVGSLAAVQGVIVSSEVPGKVITIHFDSGEAVKIGQPLFDLDTSTEAAQLAASEAEARLATISLERARKLRQSNTVAQAELDAAEATSLAALAQVENLKAIIEKKRIRAPFTGHLGIRQIDLGQFINSGDPVVSLQSLIPIYVDFSLPQKEVALLKKGMTLEMSVDSFPKSIFSGQLTAINPEINISTRTIHLRGTLDNAEEKLLPGMFTQVSVILPEEQARKIVPSTAIVYASYGDSIFVINEKDGQLTVDQHFVQLGEARGDYVSIISDVEVGSKIVSTGAFKLRQGMRVELNNDLNTNPVIDPKPEDS